MVTIVNGERIEKRDVVEKPKCALAVEQDSDNLGCNVIQSGHCPFLKFHGIVCFGADPVRFHGIGRSLRVRNGSLDE